MTSTYQVKTCTKCNKVFVMHIARKLCDACRELYRLKPVSNIQCKGCKGTFETTKRNKKYCTRICKKDYEHRQYMEKRYGNIPN